MRHPNSGSWIGVVISAERSSRGRRRIQFRPTGRAGIQERTERIPRLAHVRVGIARVIIITVERRWRDERFLLSVRMGVFVLPAHHLLSDGLERVGVVGGGGIEAHVR